MVTSFHPISVKINTVKPNQLHIHSNRMINDEQMITKNMRFNEKSKTAPTYKTLARVLIKILLEQNRTPQ